MNIILKISSLLVVCWSVLIWSGSLPAHYSLFAAEPCLASGKVDSTTGAVSCAPAAPCPVMDGSCVKKSFPASGNPHVDYCDCSERTERDPRDYAPACGIIAKFNASGNFVDYQCTTDTCANGCNCSAYQQPGTTLFQCICE